MSKQDDAASHPEEPAHPPSPAEPVPMSEEEILAQLEISQREFRSSLEASPIWDEAWVETQLPTMSRDQVKNTMDQLNNMLSNLQQLRAEIDETLEQLNPRSSHPDS